MKLIIDIDEAIYNHYKDMNKGTSPLLTPTEKAVAMGVVLSDNATNGDAIKALFNIKEVEMSNTYCVHFPEEEDFGHYFFKDWWNAPYKRGR